MTAAARDAMTPPACDVLRLAGAVVMLAGADGRFATGHHLVVDGGTTVGGGS